MSLENIAKSEKSRISLNQANDILEPYSQTYDELRIMDKDARIKDYVKRKSDYDCWFEGLIVNKLSPATALATGNFVTQHKALRTKPESLLSKLKRLIIKIPSYSDPKIALELDKPEYHEVFDIFYFHPDGAKSKKKYG